MHVEDYKKELDLALDREQISILSNLNSFFQHIPAEAARVNIIISPSQDGDGCFYVYGALNGPDSYVLNKKIENWANILGIKNGIKGFEPDFPMLDPFSIDFYANDIIEKVFVKWLDKHWPEIDDSKVHVGIATYSDHI